MKVIVCGYGSIGKRYVNLLLSKKIVPVVYDPYIKKIDDKKVLLFNDFKNVKKFISLDGKIKFGIIATLSDIHIINFKNLIEIGVKKILVEKPICDKLSDYEEILSLAKKNKTFVTSHYKWEIENLFEKIIKIQKKYKMGEPFLYSCIAGSCCIATSGIHWIDLYSKFFQKSENLEITANYNFDKINPRGKRFNQVAGNLYLKPLKKKITANFNFTNSSRLSPEITLIYKSHKIKLDINGKYEVYKTPKEFDRLKITKYVKEELIIKDKIVNKKNSIDLVFDNLINSNKPIVSLEYSFYSLKILLLSFVSNKLGKTVNLKNFKNYFNKVSFYKKHFRFT